MTRRDWIVSVYAGAAWGGVFWAAMPMVTRLMGSFPRPPHAALLTVAASIAVGTAGMVLCRVAWGSTSRRVGTATTIGAVVGLPVLAWFALW